MKAILAGCTLAAVLALGATATNAATVDAFGSGWILSTGDTNNSFGGGINNHYAGYSNGQFHNWFEFNVPNITVTSATLFIFNNSSNTTIDNAAVYSLHAPSAFTFSGLVDGPSFGSITLGEANDGTSHYVGITLNSLGLAYLNTQAGGIARFGGTTTSVVSPVGCFDCVAIFGYTGGSPVAQLDLNGNVPEPASWAMLIAGFGLVGAVARRRRSALAAA